MTPVPEHPKRPSLVFERRLWKNGWYRIAGIDEAGRGAWAGPVYAAAVILPADTGILRKLHGVQDSKLMTPAARAHWAGIIRSSASAHGIGWASNREIDALGIVPATKLAAMRALERLEPDFLLTDLLVFPEVEIPQTALVKGDRLALSIAAASVLAKTERDEWMKMIDGEYPQFGFARHKGYGTPFHAKALREYGSCPLHRTTFAIPGKVPPAGTIFTS